MSSKTIKTSKETTLIMFGLLFAVVLIWGVTWPLMKIGLEYISPLYFGALRMFVGAAFMMMLTLCLRQLALPKRDDIPMVLSVALLQMAIPTALMHFSLSFVDAGRASLLAFTHPIWIAPAAVFLLKEPINRGTGWGLFIGIGGLLVLFNPLGFDWSDRNTLIGNGLLIAAAMSWAAGILHVRAHNWISSPLSLSPWQMLIAGILIMAMSIFREDRSDTNWTMEFFYILAFIGVFATAFCYWGAVTVSRHLPAMVSSIGFLGVPVVGIISSAILLSEQLTLTLTTGTVLILLGLFVMVIFGRD